MLIGGDMLPVLFDVRLIGGGFCFGYDFCRRVLSSHSVLVPVLESLWNSVSKETLSDFPDFLGRRAEPSSYQKQRQVGQTHAKARTKTAR